MRSGARTRALLVCRLTGPLRLLLRALWPVRVVVRAGVRVRHAKHAKSTTVGEGGRWEEDSTLTVPRVSVVVQRDRACGADEADTVILPAERASVSASSASSASRWTSRLDFSHATRLRDARGVSPDGALIVGAYRYPSNYPAHPDWGALLVVTETPGEGTADGTADGTVDGRASGDYARMWLRPVITRPLTGAVLN